ncbi:hypothetical protein ACH5RR_021573 [Cinchona calisaya]|uniref:Uncharacterized protein n=1 Tax=Cinchona calisaya TaxID=153742 RepID=A0ABD2ZHP5_9GENT
MSEAVEQLVENKPLKRMASSWLPWLISVMITYSQNLLQMLWGRNADETSYCGLYEWNQTREKTLEDQAAEIPTEQKGCSSKIPNERTAEPQEADDVVTELLIEEISFDTEHPNRNLRIYFALPSVLTIDLL